MAILIYMQPPTPQPPPTADTALQNLQTYQTGMRAPGAVLQEREQALGVPQAQRQVSGLRQAITNTTNLLNQIAPSVQGRTATSQVTSAQAARQTANEQAPIQGNLASLGQQYGQASGDLNTLVSRAQGQAQLETEGQQNTFGNLANIYQQVFGKEQAGKQFGLQEAQFTEQQREFNTQQAETTRQFDTQQTENRRQFESQLLLEQQRFGLSQQEFAERMREFDTQQELENRQFQEQLAQNQRSWSIAQQQLGYEGSRLNEQVQQGQRDWEIAKWSKAAEDARIQEMREQGQRDWAAERYKQDIGYYKPAA